MIEVDEIGTQSHRMGILARLDYGYMEYGAVLEFARQSYPELDDGCFLSGYVIAEGKDKWDPELRNPLILKTASSQPDTEDAG